MLPISLPFFIQPLPTLHPCPRAVVIVGPASRLGSPHGRLLSLHAISGPLCDHIGRRRRASAIVVPSGWFTGGSARPRPFRRSRGSRGPAERPTGLPGRGPGQAFSPKLRRTRQEAGSGCRQTDTPAGWCSSRHGAGMSAGPGMPSIAWRGDNMASICALHQSARPASNRIG